MAYYYTFVLMLHMFVLILLIAGTTCVGSQRMGGKMGMANMGAMAGMPKMNANMPGKAPMGQAMGMQQVDVNKSHSFSPYANQG